MKTKSNHYQISEPEIDDRVVCKNCGCKISDATHDDNGGLCNTCTGKEN